MFVMWDWEAELRQRLPLAKRCWQRPSRDARGKEESFLVVTAGIATVELEFVVVEFMISSLRGVHPP
jgi:hypothetical protein